MIVYRQVGKLFVPSARDEPVNEFRTQRTVTDLPFDIIDAFPQDAPRVRAKSLFIWMRGSSQKDRPVLIRVSWKQMTMTVLNSSRAIRIRHFLFMAVSLGSPESSESLR